MLQEVSTVKSDHTVGRVKTYESIVKGENVPMAGIPESFKVLVKAETPAPSGALDIEPLQDAEPEAPAASEAVADVLTELPSIDEADTSADAVDALLDAFAATTTDKE